MDATSARNRIAMLTGSCHADTSAPKAANPAAANAKAGSMQPDFNAPTFKAMAQ
jgi:hypothetical protein